MTTIAMLVGSLREQSTNKKLARTLEAVAPEGVECVWLDIAGFPLFNEDLEGQVPDAVATAKRQLAASDAILIVSPEYNRGVPGVLKNAIDWLSRPDNNNSFTGKPAGIVGASSGRLGTAVAQSHLRQTLVYLGTRLMGQPEVYLTFSHEAFDEQDHVDDQTAARLARYMQHFTTHIVGT